MKVRFLLIVLLILFCSLAGCAGKTGKDEVINLSFRDTVSFREIRKLDGRTVSIVGFMSTTSPLDGSYFYLQNMPYKSCPFCIPNTNDLLNTLAVYAPRGHSFRFMDVPVKVTGRMQLGEVTDSLGYRYNYRIVDARVEKAEVSGLAREIRIYTDLVDRGFVASFISALEDIYLVINYEEFDLDRNDMEQLDGYLIDEIRATFQGLNKQDYTDILQVVDRLEKLLMDANLLLEAEEWDNLNRLNSEWDQIFEEFYYWLTKPKI